MENLVDKMLAAMNGTSLNDSAAIPGQGGADGKGTEGKGTEGKGANDDGKGTEGKGAEGKGAEGTEGKGTEEKGDQGKGANDDGKGAEGSGSDGKGAEGASESDDITIETEEGAEVKVGNKVTLKGEAVEDGTYAYENEEGEEVNFMVKDGVIAAIGDEAIEDLTKVSIVGGKKVKKKVRTVKKRMSAKQKQALAKARKKANTGSAKRARVKSFKKGKAMGIHNSEEMDSVKLDISTVDLNGLGDSLYEAVFAAICDKYELSEEMIDNLDGMLADDICKPVVDGKNLTFMVPVWTENDGEVVLDSYDLAELHYEIDGKFDSDSLLEALTDGDIRMQTSLIV
jgi:hypothetical protein